MVVENTLGEWLIDFVVAVQGLYRLPKEWLVQKIILPPNLNTRLVEPSREKGGSITGLAYGNGPSASALART